MRSPRREPWRSQGRSREVTATNTITETRRNDERSGTVSLPSIGRSLEASFAVVQWVINAYVLILISERETAPMRAEALAKMPCKSTCRDPL